MILISPASLISANAFKKNNKKKTLLQWKKKQIFKLDMLLTISLAIHRTIKKIVIEGSTLKIYQITQNELFILHLSK